MSKKEITKEEAQAKSKKLAMDILEDKEIGIIVIGTENNLTFGGTISSNFKDIGTWQLGMMAGFQLAQDVRTGEFKAKDGEFIARLAKKFYDEHNPSSSIVDDILKAVSGKDCPEEMKKAFFEDSTLKKVLAGIPDDLKNKIKEAVPLMVKLADHCVKMPENWQKKNSGNADVFGFFLKHGRIFHNTPDGAIFPCGKVYTTKDKGNASEHVENCEHCSEIQKAIERIQEIRVKT